MTTSEFRGYPLAAPESRPLRFTGFVKLCWTLAMASAVLGGAFGFIGVVFAKGAPQEASAAAIGCLMAVAPYCVARAVDELRR